MDGGPLTRPKGVERIGRQAGPRLQLEMIRIELLGILAPDLWVTVQHDRQCSDRGPLGQQVAANHCVLVRIAGKGGRCGPEPQSLVENLSDVCQPLDLLVRRQHRGISAEHPINLFLGAGNHFGMLDQIADGKGQKAARCLMPCYQERDALRHDVVIAQLLSTALVHAGEHAAEQVAMIFDVSAPTPLLDDLEDFVLHIAGKPRTGRRPGYAV
jgi:hypothetical protein